MQNGDRRSILEMTVIKLCTPALCQDYDSLEKRVRNLEMGRPTVAAQSVKKEREEKPAPQIKEEKTVEVKETPIVAEEPAIEEAPQTEESIPEWKEIMKILEKTCPPIHGVLNGSKAYINGAYLLIDAPNPLFRSFIKKDDSVYKTSIRKAATEVLGKAYRLGPYKPQTVSADEDPLRALSEKLKNLEIPNKENN
jgi:DNA polymerase-3 subunit gamma/tau